MKAKSMKEAILHLVQTKRGGVSFVEVSRLKGAAGDFGIAGAQSNVVYWIGLSRSAVSALSELRSEGAVHFEPTSLLVYVIDGCHLDLPVVKSRAAYERGYKKPHWLPVVINPGPVSEARP